MRPPLASIVLCASVALAASPLAPYDASEINSVWRAIIAAFIAFAVYLLAILQRPREQRPSWDVALASALLTAIFAVVAVLLVRTISRDNLAAEWLTAAVVGSEGPGAIRYLRERFKAVWKGGSNDD
jgi:drug/metabolite transporter (DMT)-like permease